MSEFYAIFLGLHGSFLLDISPLHGALARALADQRWCGRPHLLLERYCESHLLRMVVWTLINFVARHNKGASQIALIYLIFTLYLPGISILNQLIETNFKRS
jgi:hypothetical protein